MSRRIEDLIRQAQAHQAERAVAPDRIRAALPTRAARVARRRRNGTLVAVLGAAAVAVAVILPVAALRDGAGGGTLTPAAPPQRSPLEIAEVVPRVVHPLPAAPLRYRPTWLPPGVAERSRLASFGTAPGVLNGTVRSWTRHPVGSDGEAKGPALELQLRNLHPTEKPPTDPVDGAKPVDINGKAGQYFATTGKSYVQWPIDATTMLSVSERGLGLAERDLLRVARSVRPDPSQVISPLRFGWLPDGLTLSMVEFAGDSTANWQARISGEEDVADPPGGGTAGTPGRAGATPDGKPGGAGATPDGVPGAPDGAGTKDRPGKPTSLPSGKSVKELTAGRHLSVSVGTLTSAPAGGDPLIVDGRPARFVTRPSKESPYPLNYLVVELGEGRLLTLFGGKVTRDELVAIAEQVDVDPTPDLSWLGRQ